MDSDTNTYEYGPATEKFKSAIQTLQKFYEAGLIDPEFATISDDQFVERITSGKALFMFSEYLCCMNTENQGDWNGNGRVNNPDFLILSRLPHLQQSMALEKLRCSRQQQEVAMQLQLMQIQNM